MSNGRSPDSQPERDPFDTGPLEICYVPENAAKRSAGYAAERAVATAGTAALPPSAKVRHPHEPEPVGIDHVEYPMCGTDSGPSCWIGN